MCSAFVILACLFDMNNRRPNTPLTDYQRSVIKFLHRKGTPLKQISLEEDLRRPDGQLVNVKTVKYWIKRLNETGDVAVKGRSGRPKKLKPRKEAALCRYILNHEKMPYSEVRRKKELWRLHRRTVNNYALRNGIRAFRAIKKPPLSVPNKQERLDFANRILANEQLIHELIFSDEKLFKGGPSNRVQLVRRLKSKRRQNLAYHDRYVQRYKRASANADCNVWLYIWSGGKGEIFCAENSAYFNEKGQKLPNAPTGNKLPGFNNSSYTKMLESLAIPSFWRRMISFTFIQDNSPVHTGKQHVGETTADILRRNNIETIKFPANSPDIHPVEHAHKLLQDEFNRELDRRVRKPKNKSETFAILKYCWDELVDNQKVIKIYNSIESKCQKVVLNHGNNNFKG